MSSTLADLYARLTKDLTRTASEGFSEDIRNAHGGMLDRFAIDPERRRAMEAWLQGNHQPCLFGRIAAKKNSLDYCFLTVEDLTQSDDHVRNKIATSRRIWKHRALRGESRHGFLLSVCDEKVALARPDDAMLRFALRLQQLAGWIGRSVVNDNNNNDVVDEWLYLKNPLNGQIVKFTFSVDFFATAGDKLWWHDHRVPGGMAFTANSLGHMVRHQEWYGAKSDRTEWALQTAMLTISSAAKHVPHGPATYLRDETHGPLRPYTWTDATRPSDQEKLKGKDCGSYGGYLHTDHAVRPEFFRPQVIPAYLDTPYLMDFAYIFDSDSSDHARFMIGEAVTEEEVYAEIGRPGDLLTIGISSAEGATGQTRPREIGLRIEEALARCDRWRLTDEEVEAML